MNEIFFAFQESDLFYEIRIQNPCFILVISLFLLFYLNVCFRSAMAFLKTQVLDQLFVLFATRVSYSTTNSDFETKFSNLALHFIV